MRKEKFKYTRQNWEDSGGRKLDLKSRPPADHNKSLDEKYENVQLRLRDLAEALALLHRIYRRNKQLYGDRFLAFVGNEFLKNWPWKDYQFTSAKARELMGVDSTGKYDFELPKGVTKGIRYEHWTPITFFRDIFDMEEHLAADDFYALLKRYYRIVRITQEEDKSLTSKGYKSCRPVDAYEKSGIEIIEQIFWDKQG